MRLTTRVLLLSAGVLLLSTFGGWAASRASEAGPLGEFALHLALKAYDGDLRPVSGAEFDLTCAGADAFSSRLCTDGDGRATTYARPGKCMLKSRSPVRIGGKQYTWTGNVEFYDAKETRLDLSEDNASVQADEVSPIETDPTISAPAPVCGGEPEILTGDVTLPVIVRKVEPQYPPEAAVKRIRGKVICKAVIGTDGHVRDVTVISTTDPIFNASARRAISRRRYIPAQRHGQPVAIYFTMRIDFGQRGF